MYFQATVLFERHVLGKEQVLESTRNTISIHHGTNGTDEKTTVDTNPQKVLEHENLISDSEYITLEHQTGENTTHIKTAALKQQLNELHETKQDVSVAGTGITIQGQTISATGGGGGETSSTQIFDVESETGYAEVVQHVVTGGDYTLTTFSFRCYPQTAEFVLTGKLKEQLETFFEPNYSVSNGAISITNDGTTMKLINSAASENVSQHATFTFYDYNGDEPGGSV